jgi:hypothetical protein
MSPGGSSAICRFHRHHADLLARVIMVIANGRKPMRARRVAPAPYEHRTLMLPLAEATPRHAHWRRAFRALAWNVRIVPHEQLPAITCWAEFLPRFEPFGLAIADLRATSQTFADMPRHDDRTRLDSNATHAALPRPPLPATSALTRL